MIGKAAIAVVLIVAVSSTIGAFVLISSNSDGSENVVSYYDGNNKIGENREHTGSSISLLNSIESEERTLFGWSTLPNGGGTVYGPHSEFVLNGNITLYAMVADGKFTINGNNAEFEPASSARTDPLIIDLGYARGVTSVTVGSGILEKLNADDSSLRIEYYGGLVVLLDSVAVKGASVNGNLTVGFSTGITDTTEISIISGASGTQYKGSGVKAVVDSGPSYSVMKVFLVGSDGTETETVYSEADGKIQFDISGHPGFRTVELFKVDKENGNVQILPIYSNYFQKYGMFATGDVFKLSQTGGLKLSVTGATRSGDGNYVVSGKSSVSIGTSEKTGSFDIVLPEEQIGYTLTSDQDSVPLGGNCIITYKRLSGYSDKELAVSVNGTIIALNGLGELHLSDIDEDQYITVEGVYDVREYNIIIPEKQVGYVLKTSVDRLHHGQSYTVTFELEPGYGKTSEFSIHIFGGVELNLSRGETLVKDVRGEHVILVDGVEIINYNVVAGKNTVLRVNGHAASTATIFDIVTIDPAFGYVLPSTFEDLFPNTVKKLSDGYKVSGNVNFPSVVKITVGENLIANGYSAGKSFDICSGDPVMVTAESGYSLSDNYVSRLSEISGKSLSGGKYTFSEDTILPSVFRVIYMGYDSELARYYIADGD
ncbi:MAG: InlB B-repeat-containing protein, partial [Candidatus Methanoplasma sp.]|nr:InlB B-repeat-containing protein [Candidatus Methanoplasma sp.]